MHNFNIPFQAAKDHVIDGKTRILWAYCLASSFVAGYGYCEKSALINFYRKDIGLSRATAYRYVKTLHAMGYINIKKGIVYVKGRSKLFSGRRSLKFTPEALASYKSFKRHIIEQIARHRQEFFRYLYTKKLLDSGRSVETIDNFDFNHLPKDKIGVSLRKLGEVTGLCISNLSYYLSRIINHQSVVATVLSRGDYYKRIGNKGLDDRFFFVKMKSDKYVINRKLPSTYITDKYYY
jgi:hypothetical protein